MANKIGVKKSTIFKYESGDIVNIPLDKIEKIAIALDTTPAYLMGWETEEVKIIEEIKNKLSTYNIKLDDLKEILELVNKKI